MQRILMAGFALALAAVPAMAQTGQSGAAGRGGSDTQSTSPNMQAPTGAGATNPGATSPSAATTGAAQQNTATPSAGMSAVTEAQARSKLESQGYTNVTGLMMGTDGMWHGKAMRGSASVNVGLDGKGNVVAR